MGNIEFKVMLDLLAFSRMELFSNEDPYLKLYGTRLNEEYRI